MRRLCAAVLCLGLLLAPAETAPTAPCVALTFDDGPSGRFTRALLDGLSERQVRATFLLCGYRMEQYPDLTARIAQEGHEIGLHGYSHRSMAAMSPAQLRQELDRTGALLPDGCAAAFLRPPGGVLNSTVRTAARESGLALLTWSVDPRDWACCDPAAVERAVLEKVRDGDVILLHDMSDSSVEAALVIVDTLRQQGYEFLTVSELAARRGVPPEPGQTYSRFPP